MDRLRGPRLGHARPGEHVVALLTSSARYRELYAAAFPDKPISLAGAVETIACYERTIVGGRSRFDAFLRGDVGRVAMPDGV